MKKSAALVTISFVLAACGGGSGESSSSSQLAQSPVAAATPTTVVSSTNPTGLTAATASPSPVSSQAVSPVPSPPPPPPASATSSPPPIPSSPSASPAPSVSSPPASPSPAAVNPPAAATQWPVSLILARALSLPYELLINGGQGGSTRSVTLSTTGGQTADVSFGAGVGVTTYLWSMHSGQIRFDSFASGPSGDPARCDNEPQHILPLFAAVGDSGPAVTCSRLYVASAQRFMPGSGAYRWSVVPSIAAGRVLVCFGTTTFISTCVRGDVSGNVDAEYIYRAGQSETL